MSELPPAATSRREFLKNTSRVAAASALAGTAVPFVHAAENNTIRLALIGCGGRGTGAAVNAMKVKHGPVKLIAMADVFKDRLDRSYAAVKKSCDKQVDVPNDRRFVGLDGYRHAMDCLKPGDVAIFATPLAFRWVHFGYAIEKGLNVFMEKPLTADGPTSRRMLKLAEESEKKGLKVGVGLNSHHARGLQQVAQRIHDGEIGDIVLMRGYRMHGPITGYHEAKPAGMNELEFQLRKFHAFLWASGGSFSDFYIHIIDHCCWMKNAWPVSAMGLGGRHYRLNCIDQNFDSYSIEYTFPDGAKLIMDGRSMLGCEQIYHSAAHGTKGYAVLSKSGDCGVQSSTYHGQLPDSSRMLWESKIAKADQNSHQNEWEDLVEAIRGDKPFNEVKHGVEASLVTSMGRMAAHTGRTVTFDELLKSDHEYAPNLDKLTFAGPAPVMPDAHGKYPIPQPGIVTKREY
jgi:predicted dehydrogenase